MCAESLQARFARPVSRQAKPREFAQRAGVSVRDSKRLELHGCATLPEWQSAFDQSGRGSSYARASFIGERIHERAAPIPDVTPSPDRNSFLHEVAAAVESVCEVVGAKLA